MTSENTLAPTYSDSKIAGWWKLMVDKYACSHTFHPATEDNLPLPDICDCSVATTQKRKHFTLDQKMTLEAEFKLQKYPTKETVNELTKETNLTYRQIKIWFSNRRVKMLKLQRKHEIESTSSHIIDNNIYIYV